MSVRAFAVASCACLAVACGSSEPKRDVAPGPVVVEPGTIATITGSGQRRTDRIDSDADGEPDGALLALEASFDTPMDAVPLPSGEVIVLDWNGHKIRSLDAAGWVHFIAGTGIEGDACEVTPEEGGCPAHAAELNHPTDVALADDGSLAIAAWHNSKIKRLTPDRALLSDTCGNGGRNYVGDGGTCYDAEGNDAVAFDLPSGVVYDAFGNLFISDQANQVVRRLGADGVLDVVAGNCPGSMGFGCSAGRGYAGDGGPATDALLNNNVGQGTVPQGKITIGFDGALYIADTNNNVIRKVVAGSDGVIGEGDRSEEVITTIVGTGTAGTGGDGGPATEGELNGPTDVAVARDGTLYIADTQNHCVRRVDPDGTLHTAAGRCGTPGFEGDGAAPESALLDSPFGVGLDAEGNLLIADTRNHCIRMVRSP